MQQRTELTVAQADQKFSGKNFKFKRTNLQAKNLMLEPAEKHNTRKVSVEVRPEGGEWEHLELTFRSFLKDQPELV